MPLYRRALRFAVGTLIAIAATVVAAPPAQAAPNFKAPFPCGQSWTYSHHSAEVRLALDFVKNGGGTNGAPVLATAAGTAYRYNQPSGAGLYIVVEHGGGWKTYHFHLSSYSVAHGQAVSQGQQVGVTGSTGNSSGPHQHYEQLYNGVGQTIHINGQSLAPYPGSYGQKSITSDNGCGGGGGTSFMTWGSGINVRSCPWRSCGVVTTLPGPTQVWVLCQAEGETITAEGYTNKWWAKLRDQGGFMTNIYIDHPASFLPGVPVC